MESLNLRLVAVRISATAAMVAVFFVLQGCSPKPEISAMKTIVEEDFLEKWGGKKGMIYPWLPPVSMRDKSQLGNLQNLCETQLTPALQNGDLQSFIKTFDANLQYQGYPAMTYPFNGSPSSQEVISAAIPKKLLLKASYRTGNNDCWLDLNKQRFASMDSAVPGSEGRVFRPIKLDTVDIKISDLGTESGRKYRYINYEAHALCAAKDFFNLVQTEGKYQPCPKPYVGKFKVFYDDASHEWKL